MSLSSSLNISGSALKAERIRMDVISSNIANAKTTRTPGGGPFKRQMVVFAPEASAPGPVDTNLDWTKLRQPQGVGVVAIVEDKTPPTIEYEPSHPDADQNGYVAYPDINEVAEMVDMMSATRAYEANVTALNAAKNMAMRALEIGRG